MTAWQLVGQYELADRKRGLLRRLFGKAVEAPPAYRLVTAPLLVLHDPALPNGENWLSTVETYGAAPARYLLHLGPTLRLYAPADLGFQAELARCEGFWRQTKDAQAELPWPAPDPAWAERARFIERLDRVELRSRRIAYRGKSLCRLCGIANGSESLRHAHWEWPAGFRHYLVDHGVRPSPAFETFIDGLAV